ncbi:MAG: amylo-alpha-1,6-glucosidase [Methanomicrobiales archaeon]|nr:amylo-alpha-1,6-glucosidase [Methanomicrobiales archaeon]
MECSALPEELTKIPYHIRYGRELQCLPVAASREFLMTEGRRTCTSSFAGNSRRYHGLLIDNEQVILSSLHETINDISLLSGWWGDHSPEHELKHTLSAELYPLVLQRTVKDTIVTTTISLDRGLTVRWDIEGRADVQIRPLLTNRTIHDLNTEPQVRFEDSPGGFIGNEHQFACTMPFTRDLQVYHDARYPADEKREYTGSEELISPGFFSGTIQNNIIELYVYPAKTARPLPIPFPRIETDLLYRASCLCLKHEEIIAGYHWFTKSWGRDTFISLPGLLLSWDRYREAEDIFRMYLRHRKGGLIPNLMPDSYNSADGTLWLFWALFHYLQTHQDAPFVDEIIPDLEDLIMSYPESPLTSLENDLISTTPCSTWMDTPSTPREGKTVEINALWILALEISDYLEIGLPVSPKNVRKSFHTFWNEREGLLFDVIEPYDERIRPNQVIALALGLVPFDEGRRALDRIRSDLMTPYGLRSLAPGAPEYHGKYAGDPSYHNGMVWPWLCGFYVDALMQYGESPYHASRTLLPLWNYLYTDGAGMLPELFEGDSPYHPAGSVCQAWSIAEIIRARNTVFSAQKLQKSDN